MAWTDEKFYRTEPPQQIGQTKSESVLEFLVFSGVRMFGNIILNDGSSRRLAFSFSGVDVLEKELVVEASVPSHSLKPGDKIKFAFGYKRKRASFESEIISIASDGIHLQKPESIQFTNLRRNPRLQIDSPKQNSPYELEIKIKTGTGEVLFNQAELFELSQLGMSLFLPRSLGLVLPGDRVESILIKQSGRVLLQTMGMVSRVDMKRSSSALPDSYQIVILFKEKIKTEPADRSRRLANRIPVLDSKPCFVSAEHPFFPGRRIEGQVFEISSSGLSAMLEKTAFPVIPGMRFSSCLLQLPFCSPRELIFEVVHVQYKSDGETNHFKIGGEFINAPVELLKDIANYGNQVQSSFVRDLAQEDLDLLWEFMFETNFIYQSKRRQIQAKSKEILETYHRLMSTDNPLIKKIVYKEEGEIRGHLSGLRFYDHAWIIQHLNASKTNGVSAAQSVLKNMTGFLLDAKAHQKNEIYYVVSFYRPNNIYPAVLFGESKRLIGSPEKCDSYDFVFGIYDEEVSVSKSESVNLSVDQTEDYKSLIDLLVEQRMNSFIRATDLGKPNPSEMKITDEYSRFGLKRERHLIRASQDGVNAFALVELSSSGLNLSEITNSIYLFAEDASPAIQQELTSMAAKEAYDRFFAPTNSCPTILSLPSMAQARNVAWSKVYTCWILAENAMKDFDLASDAIFKDFRSYLSAFKKSQANSNGEVESEQPDKIVSSS